MKKRLFVWILLLFTPLCLLAQFPPQAGVDGSTAIHADSSVFVAWATSCNIERGFQQIDNPSLGQASYGSEQAALGKPDNNVVSLGDAGVATLTFASAICDAEGPDFAVFENALNDIFLELAFVEVSSDGEHFFRFPAVSLVQTVSQIDGFGSVDATLIHNFAGKYRVMFGTPFDLADIQDDALLNKQAVTHVRLIDVIGNIEAAYANYDAQGHAVNDPWPTPFPSSGFDLDAVGVIHDAAHLKIEELASQSFSVYPNPVVNSLFLKLEKDADCMIVNALGQVCFQTKYQAELHVVNLKDECSGLYFIRIETNEGVVTKKIIKQ